MDCCPDSFFLATRILGGQFDRVDLIKPVSNVRLCVRPYVRPSTESFFDLSEI